MTAYKLFRTLKNGTISSLFINKKDRLQTGEWLEAQCYPTKGFAVRPFWHCTTVPDAPHLSMKNRAWYKVEVDDYHEIQRPESQGGTWLLAKRIKIIEPLPCK